MKKVLLAGIALAFAAGSAMAADLPVKAPIYTKAPPVVVDPWTGFYVGANVGYSWGRAKTDQTDQSTTTSTTQCFRDLAGRVPVGGITGAFPECGPGIFPLTATTTATRGTSGTANVNGLIGGFQTGYNRRFDPRWLAGIETDFQFSGERGSQVTCDVVGCPVGSAGGYASHSLKWFGTLRGRLGWLPTDTILLYATGGLAYGRIDSDYTTGINGVSLLAVSTSTTRVGVTVGAGVEGRIAERWTLKAEYLYVDYGSFGANVGPGASVTTVTTTPGTGAAGTVTTAVTNVAGAVNTRFTDNVFRVGLNYRLSP